MARPLLSQPVRRTARVNYQQFILIYSCGQLMLLQSGLFAFFSPEPRGACSVNAMPSAGRKRCQRKGIMNARAWKVLVSTNWLPLLLLLALPAVAQADFSYTNSSG